jgi:long-chain acyl-CoA synthetase
MSAKLISGDREITLETLGVRAARAAGGLNAAGVKSGEGLAIMMRNDFAFFEASFAAAMVGAYATPVNWHFTAEEAGYIIEDSGARVLVVHADLLPQVAAGIPKGVEVLVVATPPEIQAAYELAPEACVVPEGCKDWDRWVEEHEPWTGQLHELPISMIYTSGTTGRPKGVRRDPPTPEQAEGMVKMVEHVFDTKAGMRTVVTGPMYHSAPNAYAIMAARGGGTIVLQPRFDAEELLALIEEHAITHLHMVPIMFVRLLKLPDETRNRYDLSSLEFVVHAAAPCPPDVKRKMIDWWGPVITEYYGGTESGAVVFCDAKEWLAHPGTVGRALPSAAVRIYSDEGSELPAGEVGEVYIRLWTLSDFTYNRQDERRREIERGGLITCGDVGYLDDEGYLYLCDRKRDMVISGGVNIYPAEIEAALLKHSAVQDCAVFGIPDEEYGESLAAVIQPRPEREPSAEEIRQHLGEQVARYMVPRVIEFRTDLPREDSGKIMKRKLRDPYWKEAGRQI